jgi:hypothetical protein
MFSINKKYSKILESLINHPNEMFKLNFQNLSLLQIRKILDLIEEDNIKIEHFLHSFTCKEIKYDKIIKRLYDRMIKIISETDNYYKVSDSLSCDSSDKENTDFLSNLNSEEIFEIDIYHVWRYNPQ